jgi:hypothetical protein
VDSGDGDGDGDEVLVEDEVDKGMEKVNNITYKCVYARTPLKSNALEKTKKVFNLKYKIQNY